MNSKPYLADWRQQLHQDDGQDTIEYALVIVVIVFALIAGFMGLSAAVSLALDLACPSVDTAAGVAAASGTCIS